MIARLLLIVLVVAAVALAVRWLRGRRPGRRRAGRSHIRRLVHMCHGDQEQARRLLNAQKRRHGLTSDEEAARRAVQALARDRR